MELSDAQISGWVAQFMLPFFRIAALLMVMPIIGTQLVPTRVRLYLALAISVVLVPGIPPMPQVDALSVRSIMMIAEQVLIGVMFGFILQLFFHIFSVAGQIIAMQMGMGFASMVDPTNGVSVPVLGQFMLMLVTLLFLAINGHLVVLEVLAQSFISLPPGQGLMVQHYWELAGKLSWVIGAGLLLTLPAVTALLVINLAFGVMTRAAPQLNIFSIGFPLTLALGLVIFWISLSDFGSLFQELASDALQQLGDFARTP
ncbi:Flagellar biosynthetic protein FliR [Pseudomonas sp. 8Z]|nr:Flagellar biosynthetic protein FliR [Pseudomonas sp. 8Z]